MSQIIQQHQKLIRFGIIGLTTNGVSFAIYLYVTSIGISPQKTILIMYPIAALISYLMNRRITFSYQGSWLWSTLRYIIMHTGGYLINYCLLYVCVDIYHIPHYYVELAATFVVAIYLYLMSDWFVFRKHTSRTT
jgi:putative flippase GtrA